MLFNILYYQKSKLFNVHLLDLPKLKYMRAQIEVTQTTVSSKDNTIYLKLTRRHSFASIEVHFNIVLFKYV